jgi:hypothetical protein
MEGKAPLTGDAAKLVQALGAVVAALRRELVTSDRLIVRARRTGGNGSSSYEILVGDDAGVAALAAEPVARGAAFDEWRGGVGLSLINARRILDAHGGTLHAPSAGGKASARVLLPGS